MARPEIPEEKYIDAIHQLLADGIAVDSIKPAKLQQVVGGRYSRCSEILDKFKRDFVKEDESATEQPQSPWFKDMVGATCENIQKSLVSTWPIIQGEINKAIEVATQAYELKKEEFLMQQRDDREQIDLLENQIDSLTSQLENQQQRVREFEQQLDISHQDVAKFQAIADERGESLKSLNHELQSSADTNAHLCAVNQQQMKEIESFEATIKQLQNQIQTDEINAEKSNSLIQSLKDEVDSLTRQAEKTKEEYKKQFQKFTDTEHENAELKLENARLNERCDNLNQSIESLNKKNESLQNELVNLAKSNQGKSKN